MIRLGIRLRDAASGLIRLGMRSRDAATARFRGEEMKLAIANSMREESERRAVAAEVAMKEEEETKLVVSPVTCRLFQVSDHIALASKRTLAQRWSYAEALVRFHPQSLCRLHHFHSLPLLPTLGRPFVARHAARCPFRV